ncbi:unnamed protein product [Paramecium primaurelia]|uniref:Uncharacterized protein n=1 Tax=Paramecium primaurelia TaxID=5886 RepID=A0A8S1QQF1_PARPR|nr:unnamed protein product [Paramecium primaurelia]
MQINNVNKFIKLKNIVIVIIYPKMIVLSKINKFNIFGIMMNGQILKLQLIHHLMDIIHLMHVHNFKIVQMDILTLVFDFVILIQILIHQQVNNQLIVYIFKIQLHKLKILVILMQLYLNKQISLDVLINQELENSHIYLVLNQKMKYNQFVQSYQRSLVQLISQKKQVVNGKIIIVQIYLKMKINNYPHVKIQIKKLVKLLCIWNQKIKSCDLMIAITKMNVVVLKIQITQFLQVFAQVKKLKVVQDIMIKLNLQKLIRNWRVIIYMNQINKHLYKKIIIPCPWVQINDGGHCNNTNFFIGLCQHLLNLSACIKIETQGKIFKREISTQKFIDYIFTNCESANNGLTQMSCKSITEEPCFQDNLQMSCNQVQFIPTNCSNHYNYQACMISTDFQAQQIKMNIAQNLILKLKSLESNSQNCQWLDNQCINFDPLFIKFYCYQLPMNIKNYACKTNSLQSCINDSKLKQCFASKDKMKSKYDWLSKDIFRLQKPSHQSSILFGTCEQFKIYIIFQNQEFQINRVFGIILFKKEQVLRIQLVKILSKFLGCLNVSNKNQYCI